MGYKGKCLKRTQMEIRELQGQISFLYRKLQQGNQGIPVHGKSEGGRKQKRGLRRIEILSFFLTERESSTLPLLIFSFSDEFKITHTQKILTFFLLRSISTPLLHISAWSGNFTGDFKNPYYLLRRRDPIISLLWLELQDPVLYQRAILLFTFYNSKESIMASSPFKLLLLILLVCIVGWIIFM